MRKAESKYVARVPLFDRLTDLEPLVPMEPKPLRGLTYSQLLESIQRELSALLNTRCPVPLSELQDRQRSVVDYGLTDMMWAGPMAPEDRLVLQDTIEQTVAAFEPRLRNPRVIIGEYESAAGSLSCTIEGDLHTETLREAVSFPVYIYNAKGR